MIRGEIKNQIKEKLPCNGIFSCQKMSVVNVVLRRFAQMEVNDTLNLNF